MGNITMNKLSPNTTYVIKDLARRLPEMKYNTIKKQPREWKRRVINFLAPYKLTGWFCRWYFHKYVAAEHTVNHERRMRKAYLNHGCYGLVDYLRKLGMPHASIVEELSDIEAFNEKTLTTPMQVVRAN